MKLEQVLDFIPITGWINWPVAITGVVGFLTAWVPLVVSLLSGVWLCLQIWLFFRTKPWRKQ